MEAPPRKTILGELPGLPEVFVTRNPLTVPCKDWAALLIAAFCNTLSSNFEIEFVINERF